MSESLTPFEGENLASYEALKTAIALADGFTLIFAVTNTEAGAQEVMRRLWHEGFRYQKAWLRDPERPLVDQVLESVRSAKLPVMVLGLEGLTTMRESLSRSLRNLNWTRPQWTARLPQAIVFWVTADMEAQVAREAPDLWRFRSLRLEFEFGLLPRAARAAEVRRRLRTLELAPKVRLATIMELFHLTRDQNVLAQAVQLVAQNPTLSREQEFELLKSLSLSSFTINDASLDRIGSFPNIESLSLFYTNTSGKAVGAFLSRSDPRRLEWVSIVGAPFCVETVSEMSQLGSVRGLTIVATDATRKDLRSLSRLAGLSFLQVSDPAISDKELQAFCRVKSLDTLLVPKSSITDTGVASLLKLNRLRWLSLKDTEITSASLITISQLLELRHLDLSYTSVTDENVELLATLPKLKTVDMEETWVTKDEAARLRYLFSAQHRKVEVIV